MRVRPDDKSFHVVTPSKTVGVRMPTRVYEELRRIATRDHNGISATARRLLALGIDCEREQRGGAHV